MSAYTFTRPGNIEGVGFLVVYGGCPQFSIAWNGSIDPERVSLFTASGMDYMIGDKKASQYELVVNDGGYTLKEKVNPEDVKSPVMESLVDKAFEYTKKASGSK